MMMTEKRSICRRIENWESRRDEKEITRVRMIVAATMWRNSLLDMLFYGKGEL